jgi:hypothetical protein
LVVSCGQADDTIETHWLERKGQLTTAAHRFAAARSILAFANRDAAAAPFLDGHALVVIGISTGRSKASRGSRTTTWRRRCVPTSARTSAHRGGSCAGNRVNDTHDVLIIDIDAPQPGDPLFTLRKATTRATPARSSPGPPPSPSWVCNADGVFGGFHQ